MANTKVTGALIADATITATNIADGAVTAAKLTGITTTSIAEGDKLFYTDARVGTYLTGNGYDTAANIIATITDSAPATLDTLNELAAALGDDPNYATTTANLIGTKLPLAGGTLTGNLDINASDSLRFRFLNSGTFRAGVEVATTAGDMIASSVIDDLAIRSQTNMLFSTGGNTERMRIDSSGNVGIGTTSPDKKLHIDGGDLKVRDAGNVSIQIVSSTSDNSAIQFGDDSDVNDGRIVYENTGNNMLFYTNDAEKMRITSGGNVGVGTTSPRAQFDVVNAAGVKTRYGLYGSLGQRYSSWDTWIGNNTATATNSTSNIQLLTDYISSGASATKFGFQDFGFYQWTPSDLSGLSAGSNLSLTSPSLYIDSARNVGIGTTSPGAKIHIGSTGTNAYSSTITKGSNMKGIVNTLSNNADDMIGIYFATGSTTEGTHWSGITGSRSDNASHWGTQLNFYTHNDDVNALNDATQKMVIKGDGKVGIGTTSPESLLHLSKQVNDGLGPDLALYNPAYNASSFSRIRMGRHSGRHSAIKAVAMTNGGRNTDIVFEAKRGDGGDDSVFVENVRVLASGGIAFNGDYTAANALDDYEEGTWTPSFVYDFAPPSINYTNQEGHYQKVGNKVTVWFDLYATGMNSGSYYYARLGGLPFSMAGTNQYIKAPLHHSGNSTFSVALRGGTNPVFYYNLNRTGFAVGTHVDSAYISGHFSYIIA